MRCLVASLFLFCYGFITVAQQNVYSIRRVFLDASNPTVLVASHRAVHDRYPENSLQAIEEAIRMGVDIIEIDVKVSKDGVPFLMHDRTLDRTTTGQGDPEEFTWEELQQFFIVDKGKTTGFKIPSLKEALDLAYGKIMVDLDLKTDRVESIVKVVNKTETKDIVFFFDSDYEVLSRVYTADKDLMIMPRAYSTAQADSANTLFNPPVIHIDFSFYNEECVRVIQSSNARIWINALGDPDADIKNGKEKKALKKLLKYGANILQTDEPQRWLAVLRARGLHP